MVYKGVIDGFKTVILFCDGDSGGNHLRRCRKLHLTQPPLSAQMKLLEEEAGCLLFERGSRHVQLTAAGTDALRPLPIMLELADITARELKDYRDGTAGVLRLGVVSSVGSTYLIHAVQDFQKQYPHIDFELTEGNTYQLLEQLSSGLIELALVRTPFSKQGLTSVPLIEEPLLAVGSKRYFQNKNPITLSDLLRPAIDPVPAMGTNSSGIFPGSRTGSPCFL